MEILSAEQQVVSGMNYRLVLRVKDGDEGAGSGCHGLVAVVEHRATLSSDLLELAMMPSGRVTGFKSAPPGKQKKPVREHRLH